MLPPSSRPGLVVLLASLLACTSSYKRCLPGLEPVVGASPLRCDMGDGGGADADVDVVVRMCGARPCDEPGDGVDTNGDRVDGEASDTIFVAESGNDMAMGTLPDQPVRSLPAALTRAQETSRGTILMQAGSYDSTGLGTMMLPQLVVVSRPVRIVGRYAAGAMGLQWVTRNPMGAGGDTRVVAPSAGINVVDAADVLLWGMTIEGRVTREGASAYGLVAIDAPRLVVREVAMIAGAAGHGAAGSRGEAAQNGMNGQDGASDGGGGSGGGACGAFMNPGGQGGTALTSMQAAQAATAGATVNGRAGGEAGRAGVSATPDGVEGSPGTPGAAGDRGAFGGVGRWTRDGFQPDQGARGERGGAGTGGGGGGAGFTDMLAQHGGGGGGGGGGACGGGGGEGGGGGGASIGAYLFGATTSVRFIRCSLATGRGGNGGAGGAGAGGPSAGMPPLGGAGGRGVAGQAGGGGAGAAGGRGGNGGVGGAGGPGLGGPTAGVARVGGAQSTPDLETQRSIRLQLPGEHGAGAEGQAPPLSQEDVSRGADMTPDGGATADAAADVAAADGAPADAGID